MDTNYQTTVGIVDEAGEIWSPKTVERPRDYQDYPATTAWPTDAYVVDSFELPVLPGTPPGRYSIYAEVFTRDTLQPLPAQASGDASVVATVRRHHRAARRDPRGAHLQRRRVGHL